MVNGIIAPENACLIPSTNITGVPASFVQKAALEALSPRTPIEPMVEEFRRRRDYLSKALSGMGAFEFSRPHGAFYVFPKISRTGMDSYSLSSLLLDGGVSTTPGESFGGYDENIRISYANSMENLREATKRIRSALEQKKLI